MLLIHFEKLRSKLSNGIAIEKNTEGAIGITTARNSVSENDWEVILTNPPFILFCEKPAKNKRKFLCSYLKSETKVIGC